MIFFLNKHKMKVFTKKNIARISGTRIEDTYSHQSLLLNLKKFNFIDNYNLFHSVIFVKIIFLS